MDGSQLFRSAYKDGEKHEFLSKYFCSGKKDVDEDEANQEGRAEHQGPEVDGSTFITGRAKYKVGEYVDAVVTEVSGVDLIAVPL